MFTDTKEPITEVSFPQENDFLKTSKIVKMKGPIAEIRYLEMSKVPKQEESSSKGLDNVQQMSEITLNAKKLF